MLEDRAGEGAGEDHVIGRAMVDGDLLPVQMGYDVVGHRAGDGLLLKASFERREAVTVYYDEDELAELGAQG